MVAGGGLDWRSGVCPEIGVILPLWDGRSAEGLQGVGVPPVEPLALLVQGDEQAVRLSTGNICHGVPCRNSFPRGQRGQRARPVGRVRGVYADVAPLPWAC